MNSIIDNLCDDLEPKHCLWHPAKCMCTWIVIAFAVVAGIVYYFGIRHDIADRLHDSVFLFEMGLMAAIAVFGLLCSLWLRIPDMRGMKWALPIPFVLMGVFIFWTILRTVFESHHMPHMHFHHCMIDGFYIMGVPAVIMFLMVFRGCTTRPLMMAVMNAITLLSGSYIALRLTCAGDDLGHIIFTHIAPFLVLAIILGLLARKIYKW